METQSFPIADEEKGKLNEVQENLRAQPIPDRLEDFFRSSRWSVWTACAFAALTGYCVGRALLQDK